MIASILAVWRLGLAIGLVAALGVWHQHDKSQAVKQSVAVVRAEYVAAALKASEAARARESKLIAANRKVANDYQNQKTINAAAAVVTDGKLRDFEAASARVVSPDTGAASGIDDPYRAIANQCAVSLVVLDEYAASLRAKTIALQDYAASLHLK
jgi:hypothetical protein